MVGTFQPPMHCNTIAIDELTIVSVTDFIAIMILLMHCISNYMTVYVSILESQSEDDVSRK